MPGFELPIIQPVAQRYTTELSRLQITGGNTFISLKYYVNNFAYDAADRLYVLDKPTCSAKIRSQYIYITVYSRFYAILVSF
jgi:hypothetical protein